MADSRGNITTDPKEIADILRSHWKEVFSRKEIDHNLLDQWLQDEFGHAGRAGLPGARHWLIKRKHIARAIKISGSSAPGVDKIPYVIWRSLGELGVTVLYDVALELQYENSATLLGMAYGTAAEGGKHDFNLGVLCCLPKKIAGAHAGMGDYYGASDTRPLSIVNTDNRLIASAMRLAWEPILSKWISSMQRGFLKGRSMLMNILDIDEAAMTISLKEKFGGAVIFDLKAAFPSISQEYLIKCLTHLGLPSTAINAIKALYSQVRCALQFKGTTYEQFDVTAGIRQGCPLSPLLFAATVDILLRRLHRIFPDAVIRAFADDIGAVFKDLPKDADRLFSTFQHFGKISGLGLNLPETVVIPL